MKLTALALIAAGLLSAAPTPDELTNALSAALAAWNLDSSEQIEFRIEPLDACDLRPGKIALNVATTQVLDTQILMDGVIVGHHFTYLIRLNSACDWSRIDLIRIVTHEVGHIYLGASYHSRDPHSVMYWISVGRQEITVEDRRTLAGLLRDRRNQ